MAPIDIAPATTALVLIDLQNGIVGRSLAPHDASGVIERSDRLARACRTSGATVIFVRVAIDEILRLPADAPVQDPNAPPPPASASELTDRIRREPSDLIVTKRQWGAFYGTELDQMLRRRAIRTIVIGGIATNFGVESTAREAADRGYALVFAEDAMSSVSADAHRFATQTIFPRIGRVRDTDQIIAALAAPAK